MSQQIQAPNFSATPTVVKNLLIINVLFFVSTYVLQNNFGIDVFNLLGMHYWTSDAFRPYQLVTHMFMHGNTEHIFFNMLSLWLIGSIIERHMGSKRFLVFYFVTGIGSALIHNFTKSLDIYLITQHLDSSAVELVKREGLDVLSRGYNYTDRYLYSLNQAINVPSVGASGALYGVLLAFGLIYPDAYLSLMFVLPVKAKYLVVGMSIIELSLGLAKYPQDNIAHFAHLGGMIVGYLLLRYWKKTDNRMFY